MYKKIINNSQALTMFMNVLYCIFIFTRDDNIYNLMDFIHMQQMKRIMLIKY